MTLRAMINAVRDPEREALLQHKAQLVYSKLPIDLSLFIICYFLVSNFLYIIINSIYFLEASTLPEGILHN